MIKLPTYSYATSGDVLFGRPTVASDVQLFAAHLANHELAVVIGGQTRHFAVAPGRLESISDVLDESIIYSTSVSPFAQGRFTAWLDGALSLPGGSTAKSPLLVELNGRSLTWFSIEKAEQLLQVNELNSLSTASDVPDDFVLVI